MKVSSGWEDDYEERGKNRLWLLMSKVVEVFFQFLINLSYAFSFYFFPLFYFASSPSLSPPPPPSLSYLISLTDKRLHISYLCYIYISFPPPALLSLSVCLSMRLSLFLSSLSVSLFLNTVPLDSQNQT